MVYRRSMSPALAAILALYPLAASAGPPTRLEAGVDATVDAPISLTLRRVMPRSSVVPSSS